MDVPSMVYQGVVILLIGLHGTGKSTFAAAAAGADIEVGDGLDPCTSKCERYIVEQTSDAPQFTIIDTPGFADKNTTEENMDVLRLIAEELRNMGQERVSGIIFFHSIEGARLTGVDHANLRILKSMCGEKFQRHVAFVTTRWDCMNDSEDEKLVTRNNNIEVEFKKLLPKGPEIFKFLNDGESHRPVLEHFAQLARTGTVAPPLQFAEELERYYNKWMSKRAAVEKTKAGKEIRATSRKVGGWNYCTIL
ncbi:P-loop containing nucleoside triphosphate hydrolase protein [Chaetomium fimeti]|uniref:P-loop containing nucleoside triphosphate hydrolase protein n=1 Tax=Chaetomium fimeti TaxID=1854472 RepID=A0AAE0HNM2_9PEZI|nr:P-loop containing nucleoside triphosphate hydrolase protein [Chaetomium fimeti]